MKSYWTQPSLSRDFTLLAGAIIFAMFLVTTWITYSAYNRHVERITYDMSQESERIEKALATEIESASYLLTALGKQIVLDKDHDLTHLAQMLKSFDSKGYIYSIFSWIGPNQHVLVSSNRGVLDKPMDVSDRDYVKKAMAEPWKLYIGKPIEGRVSERWVIPVAMGLTDYTGKFIGTIMVSIDISTLSERLSSLIRQDGMSFAIVSKTLIPLTQVSEDKDFVTHNFPAPTLVNVNFSQNPSGLITKGSLFFGTGEYSYYRVSANYPYIILLGYDADRSDELVRSMLWSRLWQMVLVALFLLTLLSVVRVRMIKPMLDITATASAVASGKTSVKLPEHGPLEIKALSLQIGRIGDYLGETKRIEAELRHKMGMLRREKEKAEVNQRGQAEFLAFACQDMRQKLNNVIGWAQIMRDQTLGPIENAKYRRYLADIHHSAGTLLTYLEDLLAFARAKTGYAEFSEKPLDVPTIIQKALSEFAEQMPGGQLDIKVTLEEPLPRLVGDEFRLQQIIMNTLAYLRRQSPEETLLLHVNVVTEPQEEPVLRMLFGDAKEYAKNASHPEEPSQPSALDPALETVKSLLALHHGTLQLRELRNGIAIALYFNADRLQFSDR